MMLRVRNEIRIHKDLHHPNILKLHTYHEDKDFFYIVTEHCPSGELYTYLRKKLKRPLTEAECRWYLKGLVDGLAHLHSLTIIHRDLKLSNLLLDTHHDVVFEIFIYSLVCQM